MKLLCLTTAAMCLGLTIGGLIRFRHIEAELRALQPIPAATPAPVIYTVPIPADGTIRI